MTLGAELLPRWFAGPDAGAAPCPYADALPYDGLVNTQSLTERDLTTLLGGKLVFLGGQFRASSDWVDSPVHGQVPGVYYHAMALDNLIERGERFRTTEKGWENSDLLKSGLIFALSLGGYMLVMHRNHLVASAKHDGRGEARFRHYAPCYALLWIGAAALLVGITVWGVEQQGRTPINWIGLSAVLGCLFSLTFETMSEDLRGSLARHVGKWPILSPLHGALRLFDLKKARLSLAPATSRVESARTHGRRRGRKHKGSDLLTAKVRRHRKETLHD